MGKHLTGMQLLQPVSNNEHCFNVKMVEYENICVGKWPMILVNNLMTWENGHTMTKWLFKHPKGPIHYIIYIDVDF